MSTWYFDIAGATDQGILRGDNQDAIFFANPDAGFSAEQISQNGYLLAVADGVGGAVGGQEASQYIIEHIAAAYYQSETVDVKHNLTTAIQQANRTAQKKVSSQEAATTLVTAALVGNKLHVANIGDSRAYLVRNQQLQVLTTDHVREGKLSRYLVAMNAPEPDFYLPIEVMDNDCILLCSDGLYTPLTPQDMARLATQKRAKKAVKKMIKEVNKRGGPDNISVIVVHVHRSPPLHVWQKAILISLGCCAAILFSYLLILSLNNLIG